MAGNEREMRLRIRSVKNISQVTRALESVSAARVRKAQQSVVASRAYAGRAFEVLQYLSKQPGKISALHPLLAARDEVKKIQIILLTSDRGLAGAYNTNVVRTALQFARQQSQPVEWLTLGRKGRDLLYRVGAKIAADFETFRGSPVYTDVTPLARTALDDFISGRVDEVYVAYTDYINAVKQVPQVKRILPLSLELTEQVNAENVAEKAGLAREYVFEPSASALLDTILPRFTQVTLYQCVLESLASEHSARMVAMRNATENAKDLIVGLRLAYNKSRQLNITSDLLDIVGGVEALAKSTQQKG
jgi:F-type H+-transporting ATPase subunit gamma